MSGLGSVRPGPNAAGRADEGEPPDGTVLFPQPFLHIVRAVSELAGARGTIGVVMAAPPKAREGKPEASAGRPIVAGVAPFLRPLSARATNADLWPPSRSWLSRAKASNGSRSSMPRRWINTHDGVIRPT